jgi:hypothetical protein
MSEQQPEWKRGFWNRAGYYLLGLSIGLVLLAVLQMAKSARTQQDSTVPAGQSTPPR